MKSDRGAAGILVLFLACVVLAAVGVVGGIAQLAAVRAQVSAAADLAALAAVSGGGCGQARRVAGENGAELVGCSRVGSDVLVEATQVLPILGRRLGITASARAGPP